MKRTLTLIFFLLSAGLSFSQIADRLSYQAVIRNAGNQLVRNHIVGMRISILQGSATGTVIYQETYDPEPITNDNGLISLEIGGGIPVSGSFSDIDWSAGPFFLKSETDPDGGTNYTITGTSQILSVPFAFYAREAGNGFSGDYHDLINKPVLFDGTWNNLTGKPTTLDGYGITDAVNTTGKQIIAGNKTFADTINAGNHPIINLAEPVNEGDAATKAYVDNLKEKIAEMEKTFYSGAPAPSTGLIAFYPFNGNANDESPNGYNGTVKGAALTSDRFGRDNSAYLFTVANKSHITLNSPVGNFGLSDFTISVWVKRNSTAGNEIFTQKSTIYKNSSWWELAWGSFSINENASGASTAEIDEDTLRNNIWYHFTAIREHSSVKLYLNGNLADQSTASHVLNINNLSNSEIGCNFFESPLQNFDGVIDDIRIYDRALTETEVKILFGEGGYPNNIFSNNDSNSFKTASWEGQIMTVNGLIPADSMGITLPHEHLLIFHVGDGVSDLTDEASAISELKYYSSAGGKTLTEVTNIGIARKPEGLQRISAATGVNIIMGSGFYKDRWIHDSIKSKSTEQLTEMIINDIRKGINGIHAGVIGEIGVSQPITDFEKRVLIAAARAQKATGAAIDVHFDRNTPASDRHYALDILENEGADLSHVYVSHIKPFVSLVEDAISYAERNCYIAFDMLGLEIRIYFDGVSDIVSVIKALISRGYINKILISQDVAFTQCYVKNGGYGYAHILNNIVPMLRAAGVTDEQIHTIMVENPKNILSFKNYQE